METKYGPIGYVYFLRGPNAVKIGFTTDLRRRQEALQIASPDRVFICRYMSGDRKFERMVHERFAEYRLRGEWFDLRGKLAKYLEMHIRPVDLPDSSSRKQEEVILL